MANRKLSRGSRSFIIGLALAILTASYALAQDKPSATVEFEEESLRLIIGGQAGGGTLHFQGNDYPFTLSGITVGGVGYSKLSAHGDVYGLQAASDFAGSYVEGTAGITAGEAGMGGVWMHNDQGVTMHLKTSAEGLQLAIGAGGISVEMSE